MVEAKPRCMFCDGTREVSEHEVLGQSIAVCAFCAQNVLRTAVDSANSVQRLDAGYQPPSTDHTRLGQALCEQCAQPVIWATINHGSEIALDAEQRVADGVPKWRRWRLLPQNKASKWPPQSRPDRCHVAHFDICGANTVRPSERFSGCPAGGYLDNLWENNRGLLHPN
ncbi:hypothetical protein ACQPXM_41280 (plasmid) [Kribbella sp. CA-253562]|uniref:hypothetical protein n=1 Tax=Kribbella sp. CA-253562 TaxID=3239942 RepID=UPI003D93419D